MHDSNVIDLGTAGALFGLILREFWKWRVNGKGNGNGNVSLARLEERVDLLKETFDKRLERIEQRLDRL